MSDSNNVTMTPEDTQKLQSILKHTTQIMQDSETASFAYMDQNQFPHVATRSIMKTEELSTIYISSNTSGSMAQSVAKDSRGSVCFLNENNNITLVGHYHIISDQELKEELWLDWFINHYPEGPTDPEYCVMKFTTESLSVWVNQNILQGNLVDFSEILNQ